jgi:hypothetical protein
MGTISVKRADFLARLVGGLAVLLDHFHEREDFALHANQQLAGPGTHDRVGRHQLRMRETLVDVLVDDVRLEQHQVALDQNRHAIVRIDRRHFFRLVEHIDIDHLKSMPFSNRTIRQRWLKGQVVPE